MSISTNIHEHINKNRSITVGTILGAADLSGQALEKQLSKNNDDNITPEETGIDWARALRFAIFGLVLQAPWNHFYYLILDGALPTTTPERHSLQQLV